MRQGDAIGRLAEIFDPKPPADYFAERARRKKPADGKLAHGQNQLRTEQGEFRRKPARAICNLVRVGYPIAAGVFLAWETAADRRKVDAIAGLFLAPAQRFAEPLEQRLPGRPGKGPAELRLFVSGRLTYKYDPARQRAAYDNRTVHLRAERAALQTTQMSFYVSDRTNHGV